MKKIKLVLLGLLCFIGIDKVYAASASISAKSQVEVGQNVTATVKVTAAAWDIKVNGTGNTNGCSTHEVSDSGTGKNKTVNISVTCKASSTGIIKISYSGDITDADGSNKDVSGSKSVTVVAARPKSTNNYLKSLEVEGTTISPEFNKDTLEYTATLEAGTEKATIVGEKADNYASVSGVGEKDVVEGENRFEVVVTSESGQARTYIVTITVKEFDPIIVKVNGEEYNVVRKLDSSLKPESFNESTIKIGEDTIQAFYSEVTNTTLVGLKDENGKVLLFKYEEGKYTRYYEFKFNQLTINIIDMDKKLLPKGYSKYTAILNEEEVVVYKFNKKSNYGLVYGVDVLTGEKDLYQVDLKNYTVQLYNDELIKCMKDTDKTNLIIFAILGGVIFLLFLIIIAYKNKSKRILKRFKSEKQEQIKDKAIKESKEESVDKKIPEKHEEEIEKDQPKKKKSKK